MKKYTVKPPKDLRSKFILKMEARTVAEEKAAEDKRKAEEEQRVLVSGDIWIVFCVCCVLFVYLSTGLCVLFEKCQGGKQTLIEER